LPKSAAIKFPAEFLTSVPAGKHIAMYHNNERYGEMMKLWYLANGLIQGESAVYVTQGDPGVVRKWMKEKGVDVDYYEHVRHLLYVRKVADPFLNPRGLDEGMREMCHQIFNGVGYPCRVTGSSIAITEDLERMSLNLEVERNAMAAFEGKVEPNSPYQVLNGFEGSVLCHYNIAPARSISEVNSSWLNDNMLSHHAYVIQVTDSENERRQSAHLN